MVPWGLRFLRQSQEARAKAAADSMSALCAPSIDLFEKHLRGTGQEDLLTESIYVQAFRDGSKATLDGLDAEIRRQKGAEMEVVGRDSLIALEPALGPDFKAGVLVKGAARVRSPGRVAAVLADKARAMGAEFITADIKHLRQSDSGWTIHFNDEMRHADRVVLCLGAWSGKILADLGIKVPLISERGYHAEFGNPGITLNNSVMDVDGKFIASSMEGGVRVAGHAEFAPPDARPSKRHQDTLARVAKAAFPDLRTEDAKFWVGCRPSFPDSLPIIDAPASHKGLHLNFGHSHYGLMMSPASGELTAQMICGDRPNQDMSVFSAERF